MGIFDALQLADRYWPSSHPSPPNQDIFLLRKGQIWHALLICRTGKKRAKPKNFKIKNYIYRPVRHLHSICVYPWGGGPNKQKIKKFKNKERLAVSKLPTVARREGFGVKVTSRHRDYTVRGQSNVCVFQNIDPHPLTARRVCNPPPPRLWWGGGHTRWVERGWGGGSIFWKTPNTALYSTYVITLCL